MTPFKSLALVFIASLMISCASLGTQITYKYGRYQYGKVSYESCFQAMNAAAARSKGKQAITLPDQPGCSPLAWTLWVGKYQEK